MGVHRNPQRHQLHPGGTARAGRWLWAQLIRVPVVVARAKAPEVMIAEHDLPIRGGQWYRLSLRTRSGAKIPRTSPGQCRIQPIGWRCSTTRSIEEPGMSIRHLLHPVPVKYHHRHRSSPVALVIVGRPPTAVISRAVIKLEWMDLERIEIHSQRRGEAAVARPTASELGFHTIEPAAPVPMIVAFTTYDKLWIPVIWTPATTWSLYGSSWITF